MALLRVFRLLGSGGRGHLVPDVKGPRPQQPLVRCAQEMPSDAKEIVHGAVDGQQTLRVRRRLEPPHLPLPVARRLVRDLRPIVRVLPHAVDDRRHHASVRRSVTPQPVL